MNYKVISKGFPSINQAILMVAKLKDCQISSEVVSIQGLYYAQLINTPMYQTERGARKYIEKLNCPVELEVVLWTGSTYQQVPR